MCVKNCFNCRYGWTTGECSEFIITPRNTSVCWTPMTEGQLLAKSCI
jgi:hypothetical protein